MYASEPTVCLNPVCVNMVGAFSRVKTHPIRLLIVQIHAHSPKAKHSVVAFYGCDAQSIITPRRETYLEESAVQLLLSHKKITSCHTTQSTDRGMCYRNGGATSIIPPSSQFVTRYPISMFFVCLLLSKEQFNYGATKKNHKLRPVLNALLFPFLFPFLFLFFFSVRGRSHAGVMLEKSKTNTAGKKWHLFISEIPKKSKYIHTQTCKMGGKTGKK